jgi:N-acyl-D-aspartate/D-glutamate deacylase
MTERSLLLRGGLIVDGTGGPGRVGDVLVVDGRIVEVGQADLAPSGVRTIEVEGMVLAPGFIDVHTHYDAQVCWDTSFSGIGQYGTTTVVMGNCGIGMAPVREGDGDYLAGLLAHIEGMPLATLQALQWDWPTMRAYLDDIDRPLGANVVSLVGHSPLRRHAMGDAAFERTATDDELHTMQHQLRDALAAGAWGFSSSVAGTHVDLNGRPAPSRLADKREFTALASVLGEFPFGIVGISPESKLRGLNPDDRELLTMLSLVGGASVNWNPLVYSPHYPDVWRSNLAASADAASAGGRVYAVFNPTGTGGTRVDLRTLFLFSFLPEWAKIARLPHRERVTAFSDAEVRDALDADLTNDTSMGVLTAQLRTMWDVLRVTVVRAGANREYVGRLVGDIARERNQRPLDTMLDIAVADDLETVFMQEDVRRTDDQAAEAFRQMADSPYVLYGGSDAGAHSDILANESLAARAFQWRVREEGSLGLEETVRRFTSAIAAAIGLDGRGLLQPGFAGDIAVFDPERINAGDAFVVSDLPGGGERMMTKSVGVEYTIIDGMIAFDHGEPTSARPGRLLRAT